MRSARDGVPRFGADHGDAAFDGELDVGVGQQPKALADVLREW